MPDIIQAAGVELVEVGTTNRTHAEDYEHAIPVDGEVATILRVHPSNFAIAGFTEQITVGFDAATCPGERSRPPCFRVALIVVSAAPHEDRCR